MKKLLLASALCMALPAAAIAQNTAQSMPQSMGGPDSKLNSKLSGQDRMFIKKAADAGLAEVADGKLAKQQGGQEVQQVAARMVTDHKAANQKLASLATQLGDPAPMLTDSKHESVHEQLSQLSGSRFDAAYLQDELQGHEKVIALFQQESASGSDPQLTRFAADTLPTLQMHLDMIEKALTKKGEVNG